MPRWTPFCVYTRMHSIIVHVQVHVSCNVFGHQNLTYSVCWCCSLTLCLWVELICSATAGACPAFNYVCMCSVAGWVHYLLIDQQLLKQLSHMVAHPVQLHPTPTVSGRTVVSLFLVINTHTLQGNEQHTICATASWPDVTRLSQWAVY